jgi:integrase
VVVQFGYLVDALNAAAKLRKLACRRFHDLRHSAGSLMIQAGVKPKDVQAILRHSKVSTTMDLYVHSYDEDLRAAVGKLGTAIGDVRRYSKSVTP